MPDFIYKEDHPYFGMRVSQEVALQYPYQRDLENAVEKVILHCGLWEEPDCEVLLNYPIQNTDNPECPHYTLGYVRECRVNHGGIVTTTLWYIKQVRIYHTVLCADNEGGYNSTGVCVHCFLDQWREHSLKVFKRDVLREHELNGRRTLMSVSENDL